MKKMIIKEKEMIKRPKQKFWSWIAYNRENLQQGRGYEERIIDLEHRNFVLQKKRKLKQRKNDECLCDLWISIKETNSRIVWVSYREGGEQGVKEIIAENFQNMRKRLWTYESTKANRSFYYLNAKIFSKTLKAGRGEKQNLQRTPLHYQQISLQKLYRPGNSRLTYLNS